MTTWSDIQRQEDDNPEPLSFAVGSDFDPWDHEEVEIVMLASERDAQDRMAALERQNANLRAALARYEENNNE